MSKWLALRMWPAQATAVAISLATPALAEDLGGGVELTIKAHASFVLEWRGVTIYVDPSRGDPFQDTPPPDLILVTRGRVSHLDVDKIRGAITPDTVIIAPPNHVERRIRDTLGGPLGCRDGPIAQRIGCAPTGWEEWVAIDGEAFWYRGVGIEVLAEGFGAEREGCCASYLLTFGSTRILIAGETESDADMIELDNIDVAFIALRPLPAFGAEEAAAAIREFRPRVVYPYIYLFGDDPAVFSELVGERSEVRLRDWYDGERLRPRTAKRLRQ